MPIVPIAAGERGTGEGHEETNQTRGYDTHDDHTRHTVWRQEEMGFISHWALCPLPRSQPRLRMEKERSGQLASQNVTTDGSSTSPADLHSRTWPVENRIPHVVREAVKGQGGTRFDDRDRNRIGMNNHGSYVANERERTPPPTYSVLARGLSASQRRDGGKKSHQSRSPLLARASALFFFCQLAGDYPYLRMHMLGFRQKLFASAHPPNGMDRGGCTHRTMATARRWSPDAMMGDGRPVTPEKEAPKGPMPRGSFSLMVQVANGYNYQIHACMHRRGLALLHAVQEGCQVFGAT